MSLKKLKSVVLEWMPIIDDILAKRAVQPSSRPFESAVFLFSERILELKIEDGKRSNKIEDFWDKQWFADIYSWIEDWYKERYGEAQGRGGKDTSSGLIILHGTPFKINIPITITKPHKPDDTVCISFPLSVLPEEDSLDWIENPPNLEKLSKDDGTRLKLDISKVGTSLRVIYGNLFTADITDIDLGILGKSISTHLSIAVTNIISLKPENISLAFWEMHMANEKAIKLYLKQRGVATPNTHNLTILRRIAEENEAPQDTDDLFSKLPSEGEAIRFRYGEEENINLERVVEVYDTSLKLIEIYTGVLKRRIVMKNASLYLKTPPWKRRHNSEILATDEENNSD